MPSTCSEEIWNFVHTLGGIEIISIEALYCVKQIETYTSFHRRMIHMACVLPWWCSRVSKKFNRVQQKNVTEVLTQMPKFILGTIQLAWYQSPVLEQITIFTPRLNNFKSICLGSWITGGLLITTYNIYRFPCMNFETNIDGPKLSKSPRYSGIIKSQEQGIKITGGFL